MTDAPSPAPPGTTTPEQPAPTTPAERAAMLRALELAASPDAPRGPNPRVGCVLLDAAGRTVAEGHHRGAGTPHAEAAALAAAGDAARGTTAVVTLEPCAHTGRTGPCADALIAAGVARVVLAQSDPNPVAAGGAVRLRAAGVDVAVGLESARAQALNEAWTFAVTHDRPMVTWKVATTLDGRVAAPDGTSRWITGPEARAEVHALRAEVDAILVGTGTVLTDDPSLTARNPDGTLGPHQPIRVVLGRRAVPARAAVRDGTAPLRVYPTQTPAGVLADLYAADVRHVLLEGGPTLAAAFLRAGLVDRVIWYLAPTLLGAGPAGVGDLGIVTLAQALGLDVTRVTRVGADVRLDGRMGT